MKHTIESCKESASKFTTRNEWKKNANSSWQAANRNGWMDECCTHMIAGKAGPKFGQRTYTTKAWVEKAIAKHSGRYEYSECGEYESSYSKMKITCREHGVFEQGASSHLLGIGCPKCGTAKQVAARTGRTYDRHASNRLDLEGFVERARVTHGGLYDYSKVIWLGNKEKVEIICPDHGSFWQRGDGHLSGKGCAQCFAVGPSRAETEVFDFIRQFAPDAEQSVVGLLEGRHELDILIPSKMLAVEFNGLIWHSSRHGRDRQYHQRKSDQTALSGCRLIHIWADEWRDKRAWCEAFLKMQMVGPDRKFYARGCGFKPISPVEAGAFHETYHLQGRRGGESFGVYSHADELLAVATVQGGELARWTVKFGVVIVGALSKVMKMFDRQIFSFCDTGKHSGSGYLAAGFALVDQSYQSYYYTNGSERRDRRAFQKHKLAALPGVVGGTEKEMAESLGWYQIGGCRQLKFMYNPKQT